MPWPFTRRKPDVSRILRNAPAAGPVSDFAFGLFRELAARATPENVFISPASIRLCLSLVYDGARGETRRGLAQALGLSGLEDEAMQLANAGLKSALRQTGAGVQLLLATSLWSQQGIEVDPQYLARARDMYDAEIHQLDFAQPDAASRINTWVNEKTAGKIAAMADRFDPLTVLVVLNAIYFKGLWAQPFQRELTRDEPFVTGSGQKKILPAMWQGGRFSYHEQAEFQAVCLPYQNLDMAMYIFLPARNFSLAKLLKSNSAAWEKWMRGFDQVKGTLCLPRFKIDYVAELRPVLASLGMAGAFDPEAADFGGIRREPPPFWVGNILHRAVAELNEQGTEATAATMVTLVALGKPLLPQRSFEMIVDRPFLFVIRERRGGNILFIGTVADPE